MSGGVPDQFLLGLCPEMRLKGPPHPTLRLGRPGHFSLSLSVLACEPGAGVGLKDLLGQAFWERFGDPRPCPRSHQPGHC